MHIMLSGLPMAHPLRNTPLKDIRAEHSNPGFTPWVSVADWRISDKTYNETLDLPITKYGEYRVVDTLLKE